MLKIFQTIRLLSRHPNIHSLLFQEGIINFIEFTIEKLMNNYKFNQNSNSEILDNLLIEIISIIKRYFTNISFNPEDEKELAKSANYDFVEKIINETKLFDQMIFLLNKENLTILKLLHFIFLSVIRK